jgi:hypothetical protein
MRKPETTSVDLPNGLMSLARRVSFFAWREVSFPHSRVELEGLWLTWANASKIKVERV